jgi:DNA processing protein
MSEPRLLNASSYPEELADLGAHIPVSLWMRGSLEALAVRPRVAIVGTRRATSYGLRATRELAAAVARAGGSVVSGLAAGIDGAAHRAALDAGGITVAVLGTGIHKAFPVGNRTLQEEIANAGVVLSELDPDDHGTKFSFPQRNRLIAALAAVVVVVEAPGRSGALDTADRAEKLGRTIAAVPGPIDQPQSEGTNRLIRDGAQIITSAEDLLALIGLTPPLRAARASPDSDEGKVWRALAHGAADMDTLCHRSGLPAAQCLAAVTALELSGSIECLMSGEIRRR